MLCQIFNLGVKPLLSYPTRFYLIFTPHLFRLVIINFLFGNQADFLTCFFFLLVGYLAIFYFLYNINTMQEGTVKFFNNTKGFGFIKPSDSSEDIFVHESGLIDEIRENDKVKFDLEKGRKGMNAVNVELVD